MIMTQTRLSILLLGLLVVIASGPVMAQTTTGTVRAGYVFTDHEGNRSMDQTAYNIHEGLALSLEDLRHDFTSGLRIRADLQSFTLENRKLRTSVSKSGLFDLSFTHRASRRVYDFGNDVSTKRHVTNTTFWVQPHRMVRLFGGLGLTTKDGEQSPLVGSDVISRVDYDHTHYNAGVRFQHQQRYLQADYRGTDFEDNTGRFSDRTSSRVRLIAGAPLPGFERLSLSLGFQHYSHRLDRHNDTLTANTVWGAARYLCPFGTQATYSFMFDRARRTGDWVATDNIAHAVSLGRTWPRLAGLTVGYRYYTNDDLFDELSSNGYYFNGWFKPVYKLTVRAGLGSEGLKIDDGRTLTGKRDRSRQYIQARWREDFGYLRARYESRRLTFDDIDSETDYSRVACDGSLIHDRYGQIILSYSYNIGQWDNSERRFEFTEHVFSADLLSAWYRGTRLGFGTTYYRSYDDVDVERFVVRFSGDYEFVPGYTAQLTYSAYNYDNLSFVGPTYTEYYTGNIVHLSLAYRL
jgi:hypothetical protein